ncbi:hypothetical protein [Microbulbifer rhizosphaerae]|uniref:CYTH domain-containing protein n=1 Tax=Microbulbifer rhizosphaerae TaxID=1562603 RepID=A0A7W4W826_9GAMM|nr:hypothetical protein [Microbulbifer rhizosphaerae]MBB3059432.1 hypothetical protein [Microbulbifer rhizosphaerae]
MVNIIETAKAVALYLIVSAAVTQAQAQSSAIECAYDHSTRYVLDYSQILPVSAFFNSLPEQTQKDPSKKITSELGRIKLTTRYFDTPDLRLLENGSEISFRTNHNLPVYRQEKEVITIAQGGVFQSFNPKNYKQKVTSEDSHPLIGRIQRKYRPEVLARITQLGIDNPLQLQEVLLVDTEVVTHQLRFFGNPITAISIKSHAISNFGVPTRLTIFEIERINQRSQLEEAERKQLANLLCTIEQQLKDTVPGLDRSTASELQIFIQAALHKLPLYNHFRVNPLYFKLGQIAILATIGFLLLYLIQERHHPIRQHWQCLTSRPRL